MSKTLLIYAQITLAGASLLACGGPLEPAEEGEPAAIINDPDGPPVPDPTSTPPNAPSNFRITGRGTTDVTVGWTDASAYETRVVLERSVAGGAFTIIRTYGALSGAQSFNNTGLTPDQRYCYRVKVSNSYGTKTSRTACADTRPAVSNAVGRLQLLVSVADVADAGTDDGLSVRLNDLSGYNEPHGSFTHLDYSRDDFERNSSFPYDLDLAGVADLGDINQIFLEKTGSDGLCLRELQLLVNGRVVFVRTFGNTSSSCLWLDNSPGHSRTFTVPRAELRSAAPWQAYQPPALQLVISRAELESRIEGLTGNAIHGSEIYWGHIYGRAVEISQTNATTLHIDLDLAASVDWLPNPEVDVDMDLGVGFVPSGGGWELQISTINSAVNVDYAWWAEAISVVIDPICAPVTSLVRWEWTWDCASSLEDYIRSRVERSFEPLDQAIDAGRVPCPNGPAATVGNDGSLVFGCR